MKQCILAYKIDHQCNGLICQWIPTKFVAKICYWHETINWHETQKLKDWFWGKNWYWCDDQITRGLLPYLSSRSVHYNSQYRILEISIKFFDLHSSLFTFYLWLYNTHKFWNNRSWKELYVSRKKQKLKDQNLHVH